MGSGPGGRNQDVDTSDYDGGTTEPQWGPALGAGISCWGIAVPFTSLSPQWGPALGAGIRFA